MSEQDRSGPAPDIAQLRAQLAEAEDTLEAIRRGRIDAVAMDAPGGTRIVTIAGAERPYRVLIDQIGEGVASLTPDGAILFCNRPFRNLLGLGEAAAIERNICDFFDEPDGRRLQSLMHALEDRRRAELDIKRDDGSVVPVRLSATLDNDDGVRTICIVARDIGDERRAEEKLREMQKLSAVAQLTAGVAHDFNNLLLAIIGNLDILQLRLKDVDLLGKVHAATQAALGGARLIKQLLAFARRQDLVAAPVNANTIIRNIAELLTRTLGPSGLDTQFAPGLWHAIADVTQLEMITINLTLNARDAMPNGGILRITTENVAAGARPLPADLPFGDYVCLSFADNGVGMTPETRARATEPFYTTKPVDSGTGLGLSQVYGVAHQFGGTVDIVSEPGVGTTVSVFLPRAGSSAEAAPGR